MSPSELLAISVCMCALAAVVVWAIYKDGHL